MKIEIHASLSEHKKVGELAAHLGIDQNEAIGLLVRLWLFCITQEPSGDLSAVKDDVLIAALGHRTRPKRRLREALTLAGFLDPDGHVHDWNDYSGRLFVQKEQNKENMRRVRKKEHKGGIMQKNKGVLSKQRIPLCFGDQKAEKAEDIKENGEREKELCVTQEGECVSHKEKMCITQSFPSSPSLFLPPAPPNYNTPLLSLSKSGGDDIYSAGARVRMRVNSLATDYWSRILSAFEENMLIGCMRRLALTRAGPSDELGQDDFELLEYAFEAAACANACNVGYVCGFYARLHQRGIYTPEDYAQFELRKDGF